MKIEYYVKDKGQTEYHAEEVPIKNAALWHDDPEYLAEKVASYVWDHHDGWEWLSDGSEITLLADGEEIGTFEIEVEFEPVFYARRKDK